MPNGPGEGFTQRRKGMAVLIEYGVAGKGNCHNRPVNAAGTQVTGCGGVRLAAGAYLAPNA